MELYFAPLACSLASRIAFYEAGAQARYCQADLRAKKLAGGADYRAINPMGQVPVLRTEDGQLLTENVAVLHYIADQYPQAHLLPAGGLERYRAQQWLSFVSTELHKGLFTPLLDSKANDGAKAYARDKGPALFGHLAAHLRGRDYLLDQYSVADIYLVTVLNWAAPTGFKLREWPVLNDYHQRLLKRPVIARALAEEYALYQQEQAARAAA